MAEVIDQVLRALQGAARAARDPDDQVLIAKLAQAQRAIAADSRYTDVDTVIVDLRAFAQQCQSDRTKNHVPEFRHDLDALADSVREVTVVFGLSNVTIDAMVTLGNVEFCTLPKWPAVTAPQDEPRAAVRVRGRGTDIGSIVDRCRLLARDTLRRLRIVSAGSAALQQMLLFELDGDWALEDGTAHGRTRPSTTPVPLELNKVAALLHSAEPAVLRLPTNSPTGSQQQAQFALLWLDKAALSADALDRSIFSIIALESLLGDKAEGLKAQSLVFYRVMLARVVSGWLPNPSTIYTFYDKVRSFAVHGSIPKVTPGEVDVDFLVSDARCALDEYLRLCEQQGFAERGHVKRHLREHEAQPEVLSWLRELDPEIWNAWEPT